ncbi:Panacea domain-containing protein [Atlantibacter hermannii]|uniref:Panacea domain-containing protein n=1 Tax=Atlantibacter hermannii TaxID=565 RepID=UPI0028AEF427|nr:Panacea domain-containing protein [Atlantibacter hermannii]
MLKIRFDSEKALEAILYVASKAPNPDLYHVGKILYFADRAHLERYGRLITGDEYKAMKDGPVAENTYDIIKIAQGKGRFIPNGIEVEDIKSALRVYEKPGKYRVEPLRAFNENVFSDSDLMCIDYAIEKIGSLSFGQIRDLSHDEVWQSANENEEIPLEVIASSCKDGDKLVSYLFNGR